MTGRPPVPGPLFTDVENMAHHLKPLVNPQPAAEVEDETPAPTELPAAGELRVEWMRLDDLVPAGRNARVHDLDAIGGAIDDLGFTTELKIDEATGKLWRGHGRLSTLRRKRDRGADVPDGIRDDGDDWMVPVVRGWSSRNALHAEASALAENTVGQTGGFDDAVLAAQLEDLAAGAPELLRATQHSQADLDALLDSVGRSRPDDAFGALSGVSTPPWDELAADPFAERPRPPETDRDEQWDSPSRHERHLSAVPDPPAPTEEPPGPVDVSPAWRTLHPWRAEYHPGGHEGAGVIVGFLSSHRKNLTVQDTVVGPVVLDGLGLVVRPGEWVTRDGQTGALDTWTSDQFLERFVPANEPARRATRSAKPVETPEVVDEPGPEPETDNGDVFTVDTVLTDPDSDDGEPT